MSIGRVAIVYPGRVFPPAGGGSRRVLNLLAYLKTHCQAVDLYTLGDRDVVVPEDIAALCDQCHVFRSRIRNTDVKWTEKLERYLSRKRYRCDKRWQYRFGGGGYQVLRQQYPFDSWVRDLWRQAPPDVVISTYVWSSRLLAAAPAGALRMLDTIDLQHVRQADEQGRPSCSRAWEVRQYRRSDVLLAIQPTEAETLRTLLPEREVLLVPHAVEPVAKPSKPTGRERVLLFVGNAYAPNIDGMKDFLRVVWPKFHTHHPDVTLRLVGRVGEAFPEPPEGVQVLGFVDDLDALYREATLVINPTGYGTGLKIKSIEALSHGQCLVATPYGLQGLLHPEGEVPWLEIELDDMAAALAAVLSDPERRRHLAAAGLEYIRAHYSPEACFGAMRRRMERHTAMRAT